MNTGVGSTGNKEHCNKEATNSKGNYVYQFARGNRR